jgi:hypothetical protein
LSLNFMIWCTNQRDGSCFIIKEYQQNQCLYFVVERNYSHNAAFSWPQISLEV